MVNALLMVFGPDARNVQVDYQLESFEIGKILVDKARVYAARRGGGHRRGLLFAFFSFTLIGKAIRACADNHLGALVVGLNVKHLYALTFGLGSVCVAVAGLRDGAAGRRHAAARARLHPARLRHRDRRRPGLDGRRAARRRADRRLGGARRPVHRALRQEHVQLRPADPDPAAPAAGPAGKEEREQGKRSARRS